jgi:aldehyde:ferredoxin oxidoreductase
MFQLWKKIPGLPRAKLVYMKGSKYKTDVGKAVQAAACSKFMNVLNGAGGCAFGAMIGITRFPLFEWLNAATGWNKTPEAYMEIGKRVQTLKQSFNVKHGIEPKKCNVNGRALGRPMQKEGANRNRTVAIETLVEGYWRLFNWDPQTGKPEKKVLNEKGECAY